MLAGMLHEKSLTPTRAVLIGHIVVNVPVLVVIGIGYVVAYIYLGSPRFIFGGLAGVLPAWLWWSAMVPRWREWARKHGADPDQTQTLGQRTGLVWPRGCFLEKTEFPLRKHN